MLRRPIEALASLVLLCLSLPAAAAPGPHLSWDHCWGDGQVANKNFACDTNAGSEALIVSYESPVALSGLTGVEVTIHISATGQTLPAWWSAFNLGACRLRAFSAVAVGDPASTCVDLYGGVAGGGIAAYTVGALGANTVRLLAAAAVPTDRTFAIGPGVEDFALRVNLSHGQSAGAGACAGCNVPVCLGVGIINAVGPPGVEGILMLGSSGVGGSAATVTWQSGVVLGYSVAVENNGGFFASLGCSPSGPNPTRGSSWGAVKSLYR